MILPQPLSRSARVAGGATQPLCQTPGAATQPLSHSARVAGGATQPVSHSAATLPESVSHSARVAGAAIEPLSHSARVAGATQPLCQSGWSSHSVTQSG